MRSSPAYLWSRRELQQECRELSAALSPYGPDPGLWPRRLLRRFEELREELARRGEQLSLFS